MNGFEKREPYTTTLTRVCVVWLHGCIVDVQTHVIERFFLDFRIIKVHVK